MIPNLKDLYALKKQAGEMQRQLADEIVEAENKGITIKMNGNQEVLEVIINPELDQETQEKYLKQTINNVLEKIKKLMAQKMMGGNFGL